MTPSAAIEQTVLNSSQVDLNIHRLGAVIMWVGFIAPPKKQRLSNSELMKPTDAMYIHA